MSKKDKFWNKTLFGYVVKQIAIVSASALVLVLLVLLFISIYTKHGRTEQVPNLKDLDIEEATLLLKRHKLSVEVIDSVYIKGKNFGAIIEQNPAPNSIVKPGRKIYLVINSKTVRKVEIPNVIDISLRQAEATLKSIGIHVSNIEYQPSEYRDLVMGIKHNNKAILIGSKLPEDSSVVLVVGDGYSVSKDRIPNLLALSYDDALSFLSNTNYWIGEIHYDTQPNGDEASYFIYNQNPFAGDTSTDNFAIDIYLTKDRNLLNMGTESQVYGGERRFNEVEKEKKEKVKDIEEFF